MKRLGVEYVISESFDIYNPIQHLNLALAVTNAAGALNPNIPVGTST